MRDFKGISNTLKKEIMSTMECADEIVFKSNGPIIQFASISDVMSAVINELSRTALVYQHCVVTVVLRLKRVNFKVQL